jgi:hypothetical protein
MSEKVWTIQYRGRAIRVSSSTSWIPSKNRQSLEIDGCLINLQQNGLYSLPASLRGLCQFEDQELWVEAVIGYSGIAKACHIYVDGELVGGDTAKTIRAYSYQQWQLVHSKGLGRFLLVRGLLCMGLPYASALTVLSLVGLYPSQHLAASFVVNSLVFGLGMGGFFWWALKQRFKGSI